MNFDQIAAFTLGDAQVPDSALDFAATLLIDTLGVAAGAVNMQAGRIARDHAARFMAASDPADAAPLLFDGRMASLTGASFALASQIDNLDGHDGYNPTKGHIGCAVVPALVALAEHMPDLSARDALTALVVSYEVAARAAISLHASVSDYHTSGAWNALGVAALGCRLKGLSREHLRHAFGIAEYHGPRSQMMREIANPTMLHDGSGMGAMVGMMAVLMAEDGFLGAPAITVEDDVARPHWHDLGALWTVELNYIKPHPICRWAHAAIDALGMLLDRHQISAAQIDRIEVRTFEQAAKLYPHMPATPSQAQYSLPFALAVRLVHGHIGPEHIMGQGLQDADVAEALNLISVEAIPRHSDRFPTGRWSDVTLHLKDGTTLESGDIHARGGPEAPMELSEIRAKFMAMTAPLPPARREAIWQMRTRLQDPGVRFSELTKLLSDAPAGPA